MPKFLVVGAGFSGAVIARQLAEAFTCRVIVEESRNHVGGNCHTERDASTGVMVHRYGPHIFNTNDERVWRYVNAFGHFEPFINRVKAISNRGVFSLPINLHTINQFFGRSFNPAEARDFLRTLGDPRIGEPQNFEEQALKTIGRDLYETFFHGYTVKQWGCEPSELPASFLQRLPVRFDYNDNYYDKRFQGIPVDGYTEIVRRILDHPNIEVKLGAICPGEKILEMPGDPSAGYFHVFYTGSLDSFFGYSAGRLSYRTVTFERIEAVGDYQGNAVLNYVDREVPFTRVHEHKHFTPWETHRKTVAFREFSKETGPSDTPYYPKRLGADRVMLASYRALAEAAVSNRPSGAPGVSFLGRLATYRYMDMEKVIGEALDFVERFAEAMRAGAAPPVFPNSEAG